METPATHFFFNRWPPPRVPRYERQKTVLVHTYSSNSNCTDSAYHTRTYKASSSPGRDPGSPGEYREGKGCAGLLQPVCSEIEKNTPPKTRTRGYEYLVYTWKYVKYQREGA